MFTLQQYGMAAVEMGAGSGTVCWYRLDERGTGSVGMDGQDGCNDQVEKTKDDGSKCQSHRMAFDSSTASFISKHSMICGTPYVYMTLVDEYAAYAAFAGNSSETSDTDDDENLNTWNALLELLTMPGSCPAIQQSLHDWEVCRVALSCHFGQPCRRGER